MTGHGSKYRQRRSFGEFAPRSRSLQVDGQRTGGIDDLAVGECAQRELQHTARGRQQRRVHRTSAAQRARPRSATHRRRPPTTSNRHPAAARARDAVAMRSSPLDAPQGRRRAGTTRSRSRRGANGSSPARVAHRVAWSSPSARARPATTLERPVLRYPEADALRDAGGDPHAGERAGTAAECDRVERSFVDIVRSQQRIDHRQHQPVVLTRHDAVVFMDRHREPTTRSEHATVDVSSASSVGACAS